MQNEIGDVKAYLVQGCSKEIRNKAINLLPGKQALDETDSIIMDKDAGVIYSIISLMGMTKYNRPSE